MAAKASAQRLSSLEASSRSPPTTIPTMEPIQIPVRPRPVISRALKPAVPSITASVPMKQAIDPRKPPNTSTPKQISMASPTANCLTALRRMALL